MKVVSDFRGNGYVLGRVLVVALTLVGIGTAHSAYGDSPSAIEESIAAPAEQLGRAFAAVAARVGPAVVSVYSEKMVSVRPPQLPFGDEFLRRFFGQQAPRAPGQSREYRVPQRGMGSGMILDRQGHILTNYHVVSDVDELKVRLADGRRFDAKIVGTDPKTDVAVIQMIGDVPKNLPAVQLGDSDALQVGYLVLAVGAPFGLAQTVTNGIISARGRANVGVAAYEDFLQTDAPINPGNSGGPLVNMRGEVIGMNSAIATGADEGQSAGVGFAIPSNMIKVMLPALVAGRPITRGLLGVVIQEVTPDLAGQFHLAEASGALVTQVNKNSPADNAGLKPGDVIVRYDGQRVADTHQLRNLVAATAPGTTVTLGAIRNGTEQTFRATIGKLPEQPAAEAAPSGRAGNRFSDFGLSVQTLTPELARRLDVQGEKGVLVTSIEPGSPAAEAELQEGDLITEVDRRPVTSAGELHSALVAKKDRFLLLIRRQGGSLFVVLRLK